MVDVGASDGSLVVVAEVGASDGQVMVVHVVEQMGVGAGLPEHLSALEYPEVDSPTLRSDAGWLLRYTGAGAPVGLRLRCTPPPPAWLRVSVSHHQSAHNCPQEGVAHCMDDGLFCRIESFVSLLAL